MPSLRQRMSTYFRQLSFIADPKENENRITQRSGCFITKYLEGKMGEFTFHSDIIYGKEPTDLPDMMLRPYDTGPNKITAACTGPDDGLTVVKRSRLHLSAGPDIDFIDINQEHELDVRVCSTAVDSNVNKKSIRTRKTIKPTSDQKAISESDARSENKNIYAYKNATSFKTANSKVVNKTKKQLHKQSDSIENNNLEITIKNTTTDQKVNKSITDICENVLDTSETTTTTIIDGDNKPHQTDNISGAIILGHCDNINLKIEGGGGGGDSARNFDINGSKDLADSLSSVVDWKRDDEHACGLSVSLYEENIVSGERAGNPIADCFGLIVRGDSAAMALADGVNWGEGARLAARSAVLGSLEYLDTAVFGQVPGGMATTTCEVFVSLLRSFWEAHNCILEVNGALSTLTVAVILPLGGNYGGKYVVCACNVGDSLGYVYSLKNGVKEFTQGSHDITSMRDMRDALGALGPVHENKPELSNLTLSMTVVDPGDIVFLTSDGLSDNFDPVVGKFVEPFTAEAIKLCASSKSTSSSSITTNNPVKSVRYEKKDMPLQLPRNPKTSTSKISTVTHQHNKITNKSQPSVSSSSGSSSIMRSHTDNTSPSIRPKSGIPNNGFKRQKFIRSNTVIEPRMTASKATPSIPKSPSGLPLVTAQQRQTLTLLRIEDLLSYGINNTQQPCQTAKNLCHILMNFATMITSAKRKILEQRELFYRLTSDHNTGIKREIELTKLQQRSARKRVVDSLMFTSLPGKLDHASIVAFTIGGGCDGGANTKTTTQLSENRKTTPFEETDF